MIAALMAVKKIKYHRENKPIIETVRYIRRRRVSGIFP